MAEWFRGVRFIPVLTAFQGLLPRSSAEQHDSARGSTSMCGAPCAPPSVGWCARRTLRRTPNAT